MNKKIKFLATVFTFSKEDTSFQYGRRKSTFSLHERGLYILYFHIYKKMKYARVAELIQVRGDPLVNDSKMYEKRWINPVYR